MKKILLVIFSLSIITCFVIYNLTKKEKNSILILGEYNELLNKIDFSKSNITGFYYDSINYKELTKAIKSNDYIIVKNKKVYINQLISNANIIVINANNIEYYNRCKKDKLNNYEYFVNKDLNELINIIRKINSSKILIINNECKNKIIKYRLINSNNIDFIDVNDVKNRV